MEQFLLASRLKLRWKTNIGMLSLEDLWDLSLKDLDTIAVDLNKKIKDASEESFITKTPKASKGLQLSFDIVKAIIDTKMEEADKAKVKAERRQKNARIVELIEQKQNEALSSKTLDELQGLLEEDNEV